MIPYAGIARTIASENPLAGEVRELEIENALLSKELARFKDYCGMKDERIRKLQKVAGQRGQYIQQLGKKISFYKSQCSWLKRNKFELEASLRTANENKELP